MAFEIALFVDDTSHYILTLTCPVILTIVGVVTAIAGPYAADATFEGPGKRELACL